jgi:hypothetical protein
MKSAVLSSFVCAFAALATTSATAHAGFFVDDEGNLSPTCQDASSTPRVYVDEWGRLYGVGSDCTLSATTYAAQGRVQALYVGAKGIFNPSHGLIVLSMSTGKLLYVNPTSHKLTAGSALTLGIGSPLHVVIPGVYDWSPKYVEGPDVIAVEGPDVIALKPPAGAVASAWDKTRSAYWGVAFDDSTPAITMAKYAGLAAAAGGMGGVLGAIVLEDLNGDYVNEYGMVFSAGDDGWEMVDLPQMIIWTFEDDVVHTFDALGGEWVVGPEGLGTAGDCYS